MWQTCHPIGVGWNYCVFAFTKRIAARAVSGDTTATAVAPAIITLAVGIFDTASTRSRIGSRDASRIVAEFRTLRRNKGAIVRMKSSAESLIDAAIYWCGADANIGNIGIHETIGRRGGPCKRRFTTGTRVTF